MKFITDESVIYLQVRFPSENTILLFILSFSAAYIFTLCVVRHLFILSFAAAFMSTLYVVRNLFILNISVAYTSTLYVVRHLCIMLSGWFIIFGILFLSFHLIVSCKLQTFASSESYTQS